MRRSLFTVWMLAGCAGGQTSVETAPPSESPLLQTLDAWAAAFNSRDMEKLGSFYAADAVISVSDSGVELRGPKGAIESTAQLLAGFEDLRRDLDLVLINGKRAVVILLQSGTHSGDFMGAAATGKPVGVKEGVTFELDGAGKIARQTHYTNPMLFLAQLGQGPQPYPAPEKRNAQRTVAIASGDEREATQSEILDAVQTAIDNRDVDGSVSFVSEKVSSHARVMMQDDGGGKEGFRQGIAMTFQLSPDIKQEHQSWSAGEWTAHFVHSTGTITGDVPEMGVEASGKPFEFHTLELFRFADGKAVEMWGFGNGLAFAQMAGLMPPAE